MPQEKKEKPGSVATDNVAKYDERSQQFGSLIAILIAIPLLILAFISHQSASAEQAGAIATVQTGPKYPIVVWVTATRGRPSNPVIIDKTQKMNWKCFDPVHLIALDGNEPHSNTSDEFITMPGVQDNRQTRFMIADDSDPAITETKVRCTITER